MGLIWVAVYPNTTVGLADDRAREGRGAAIGQCEVKHTVGVGLEEE